MLTLQAKDFFSALLASGQMPPSGGTPSDPASPIVIMDRPNAIPSSPIYTGEVASYGGPPLYTIGVGTGTTPPTENDTALENQVLLLPAGIIRETRIDAFDSVRIFSMYSGTQYISGISEVGLYGSGLLIARSLVAPFNKDVLDLLTIKWNLRF